VLYQQLANSRKQFENTEKEHSRLQAKIQKYAKRPHYEANLNSDIWRLDQEIAA